MAVKNTAYELAQKQSLPLEAKIIMAERRIMEWYEYWKGNVSISFSGGKDSTVLLHLVRNIYPKVPAVFVDTGLEFPEIRKFVKTFDNVTILKPKMSFKEVIEKYGYPVIGKEQAHYIYQYRTTKSEKLKDLRKNGILAQNGKIYRNISKKWFYLTEAPFKISANCCEVMKKRPFHKYEKETGRKPYVGTLASESRLRTQHYQIQGCNAFDSKHPMSKPLAVWLEQDILRYIKDNNLNIASVYGELAEKEDGILYTTGENRTGCMFCMFGVHLEKGENRFVRMKRTHPKIRDYCLNKLGCKEVLDYINVKYE